VDASSPFLTTSNEVTDEFIGQVLEAGYTPRGQTIEPSLQHFLQGAREVAAIGHVIYILHIHLGFINSQVLLRVHALVIEVYRWHLDLPIVRSVDDLGAKEGREGKYGWPSGCPRHLDGVSGWRSISTTEAIFSPGRAAVPWGRAIPLA